MLEFNNLYYLPHRPQFDIEKIRNRLNQAESVNSVKTSWTVEAEVLEEAAISPLSGQCSSLFLFDFSEELEEDINRLRNFILQAAINNTRNGIFLTTKDAYINSVKALAESLEEFGILYKPLISFENINTNNQVYFIYLYFNQEICAD
jgi:hypothetical protein